MEINISKSKKKYRKGGMRFTADFYWNILFFIGLTISLCGFVLGFWLFIQMNKEFDISADDIAKTQPISKARLDRALEYFYSRETKAEEILQAPVVIIDPAR